MVSVLNRSSKTRVLASQFVLILILEVCSATWSTTPGPYYQRFNDGSYNYGYSAGGGYSARQSGTAANEVSGQYSQLLPDGKLVNVRYNAGVGGFRPQLGSGVSTTARPYGFSYNTGDAFHQAAADQSGNVRGNYWYRDPAGGRHDLRYRAGPGIGFVPTGGSLAIPNGLGRRSLGPFGVTTPRWDDPTTNSYGDGPDGRFSYADPETSSVGGIYDPNGAHSRSPAPTSGTIHHGGSAIGDGSYNFGYRTPDSARQEGSDGRGNVHGAYSFRNGGGNHDLAYVAGPGIGFQPTGGTLARPNGLGYGGGVGTYGNTNHGGRAGSSGTRPTLGSAGGINSAGYNREDPGHLDPSYNAGGSGNTGALGTNVRARDGPGPGGVLNGDAASALGSTGGIGHGINLAGTNAGGSTGVGGGLGGRPLASGISGSGRRVGDGASGSGLGLRSTFGGVPSGLGSRGGVIDGNAATGGIGQGINSAGTNAGGSQGLAGGLSGRTFGSGGRIGDGSGGTGLGLRSTNDGGQSGVHGHNQPSLVNSNPSRGSGGQSYGAEGLLAGSSNGINRSGSHPDGLAANAGLYGSTGGYHGAGGSRREAINDDDDNVKDYQSRNIGIGSSAANLGRFGSRGNDAYGSGFGVNGQNGVGDHQRLGTSTTGTGGYSYGTPAASSAVGFGSFGSGGSGNHGINGAGHSAGLSVEPLQSTGTEAQSSGSGSSSGTSGGVVSGEQHDLQRNAEPEQSIQSVGGSSGTKGISKR